jgi:hypothetical protein
MVLARSQYGRDLVANQSVGTLCLCSDTEGKL